MGLNMNMNEMQALMKRLDINKDGTISEDEIYKVLVSSAEPMKEHQLPHIIDQTLKKIASAAEDFNNMKGYAQQLIRRFDRDSDGIVSFRELCDGLKGMQIFLSQKEKEGLMQKLDVD